jgi:VWFA-related protein
MPRSLRLLTAAALLVASATPGAVRQTPQTPPPQEPQQPQQPVFRAGINFVRVDVIVTDGRGTAITDLQQEDFEVFEDGAPQAVESFRLILNTGVPESGAEPAREIRTTYDEERELARDDVRVFAIFLDDYHVRRGASMGVREPLVKFIQTQLGPLDVIALMYPLTPVTDLTLTRNHESVVKAIERFEGRKFDYQPRNQFEEQYALYPAATVERIRNQVSLSALKALATHLGGLREGRKSIIVVSEGYTNALPPQLRDPVASMPGLGNPNARNPMAGESFEEDRYRFFADTDMQSDLREVYNAANRANAALYTLDPRGLAAFEFDINEGVGATTDRTYLQSTMDTLRVLADQTDGRAIVNRNDLDAGLRQVVRDSSSYYLLGYNSTRAPSDGKFHEIRVTVKRKGLQVRARKGYWALTAEETARALAPPKPGLPRDVETALSTIGAPNRGQAVRTWVGTERAGGGKARVTFVWEPVPPVPGLSRPEPSEVTLTALAEDGAPVFRGPVPREGSGPAAASDSRAAPGAPGAGVGRVSFEAAPGRLQLKMSVEGGRGQLLDSNVQEITVPDFTTPQVTIATPAVVRVRSPLEFRAYSKDPNAPATALREFRRTDRLLIRAAVYGPAESAPTPTARLLNRTGQPMSDLPVAAPAAGLPHQIDLPLAGLATGDYLVELKASGENGETRQLVAFRVSS